MPHMRVKHNDSSNSCLSRNKSGRPSSTPCKVGGSLGYLSYNGGYTSRLKHLYTISFILTTSIFGDSEPCSSSTTRIPYSPHFKHSTPQYSPMLNYQST